MPILESEVRPGLVALLDQQYLARNAAVVAPLNRFRDGMPYYGKDRPYVCLIVARDWSWWAPITTKPFPGRLAVKPDWREGGLALGKWRLSTQFIESQRMTFGPTAAFIEASEPDLSLPENRNLVTEPGVAAILAYMEAGQKVAG